MMALVFVGGGGGGVFFLLCFFWLLPRPIPHADRSVGEAILGILCSEFVSFNQRLSTRFPYP